ncbi:aldehyde dehydrogenase family protein [Oceanobacillus timonensis]|uniref:aldehyde dehydrogenase family protein n=1 Tax=Oceanobacillus timonensis TaxID=1926285 RepID=UPI0009BA02B3|nr:aldehyde dehydrogenase family protein [Oceanobacillus timonensis]
MTKHLKLYIDGEWLDSVNPDRQEVINPANQEVIAQAPQATKEETEKAIRIARSTFESGIWSEQTPGERAEVLYQIANKIEAHAEELTELEVLNNGKTIREAEADVADALHTFRYYAGLLQNQTDETFEAEKDLQTMIVKEPMGVAGLIVPWNFPILMSVWKIAPALAAGNSIILKPAEITPMTAVKLYELFEQTDLPKGVAQLVLGTGAVAGQTLSESKDVDIVSFTGSTKVGQQIMQAAAGNLKKVSLELGGKSPNIVFNDADIDLAVDYGLFGIFMGAGQVCTSGSRLLIQEDIYETFVEKFIEKAKAIRVGPGNDKASEMGAIVSNKHMDSIMEYIQIGKEEGAHLVLGGKRIEKDGLEKGFFIEPTVFTNVTSDMRIVREEIFGPVIVIQTFKDEEEAIHVANDTDYGLAGAVFSTDQAKAVRVIKKVRAGITWVNNYHLSSVQSPWGGYKTSGIGRSLGKYGLDEYQETKQINISMNPERSDWFDGEK